MQLMARADRRVPLTSHSFQRVHLFAHIAFHMILYSDSNMNPQKKNGRNSSEINENAKWCFNSSLHHWFVMLLLKLWHHSIGHNWLSFSIVLLLFMPIEKGLTSNWNYITHKNSADPECRVHYGVIMHCLAWSCDQNGPIGFSYFTAAQQVMFEYETIQDFNC